MKSLHDAPSRCGFVAIVGHPNVGKSTLVNRLLGSKISIVSPRAQTTRHRIHGFINQPGVQIILVDTPGFCAEKGPLTRALRHTAASAAADADITVVVAEVRGQAPPDALHDDIILPLAQKSPGKLLLAINKIDKLPQELLLPWIAAYGEIFRPAAILPICARTGDGLDTLLSTLAGWLPAGPALFPANLHTDKAERFICAELVREQLLYQTQAEVPHSAVVTIEAFEDGRDDADRPMCWLEGRIYVERESQKGIVVGRGGAQIKALGQASRRAIEQLLGCQIFLKLTVHVDKRWSNNYQALKRYGLVSEVG